MTKASKALTIVVTVFSILYMGIAFMMWTVRADWREKATKEFPKSRISEQQTQIQDLDKEIAAVDAQHAAAKKGIEADKVAFTAPEIGRQAQLETELAALIAEASAIAGQVDGESKKLQARQDEDKRLREDVYRLRSQYEDLVAQKLDAEANVKRQRDLLFQARGVLERVRLRAKLLDAEEGKGEYDDVDAKPVPAAARFTKTIK